MTSRKRDKINGIGNCHFRFYGEQNKSSPYLTIKYVQQWNQTHYFVAFYAYTLKINYCQLNAMIKLAKSQKLFLSSKKEYKINKIGRFFNFKKKRLN